MLSVSHTRTSADTQMLLKQNFKLAMVRALSGVPRSGDERMTKGAARLTAHAWELISLRRDVKYSTFERTGDGLFCSRGRPYQFSFSFVGCFKL